MWRRCLSIPPRDQHLQGDVDMNIVTEKKCSKCGEIKNKEDFKKNASLCKECHKKYNLQWQKENREKHREYQRKYREANVEKVREFVKSWITKFPEKYRESVRKSSRKNQDKRTALQNNRRFRQIENGGKITREEWKELKERYGHTCLRCKRKEPEIKLTLDHVLPLSLGGKNFIENAQPLCLSCNSSKGGKHIDYR